MAIFSEHKDPANDPGEWFTIGTDPTTREKVQVQLRQIPEVVEREFRKRKPRKQDIKVKKGTQFIPVDLDESRDEARERAAYALMDTKNFAVAIGDPGAAATYGTLLGRQGTVEVGKDLLLDGNWTPAVKEHFLTEHSDLVTWILERLDQLANRTLERREELEGN